MAFTNLRRIKKVFDSSVILLNIRRGSALFKEDIPVTPIVNPLGLWQDTLTWTDAGNWDDDGLIGTT